MWFWEKKEVDNSFSNGEMAESSMPGDTCLVYNNSCTKDLDVSIHHIPVEPTRRGKWLCTLHLDEHQVKSYLNVCCRYFPQGDAKLTCQLSLGKYFASSMNQGTPRAKRTKARKEHNSFRIGS